MSQEEEHKEEFRNDEERIIENMVLDGRTDLYEDLDFLPTRQSLYNSEKLIPEYDDEIFQRVVWCRPKDISESSAYFDPYSHMLSVQQGSLPDDVFLGTLLAVAVYSKYDLIENIFASRPEDFVKFGIYTCRFYVDGEWVEVITDTNLPCLRDNATGRLAPVYGRSPLINELWIPLVEKAFAKAMGSYEAIASIKVQKALLHLTGGSVQLRNIRDEVMHMDTISDQLAWQEFKRKVNGDCLILMYPQERKIATPATANSTGGGLGGLDGPNTPGGGDALSVQDSSTMGGGTGSVPDNGMDRLSEHYFIPNRLYSVVMCRDHGGYELVLMHCPWTDPGYVWTGEWSDISNDWDLYPELLYELEKDPTVPWSRKTPNGGPLNTIHDREEVMKAATASKTQAILKSTAAVVVDGDATCL
eukprot:scaffold2913_cov181-Ochromonas_danica.AAC.18